MKRGFIRGFVIVILVLFFAYAYAYECNSSSIKDEQKRLEKQFKAETGFKGSISFGGHDYRLQLLNGCFPQFQLNSLKDKEAKKAIADSIIGMLEIFTKVPREQVKLSEDDGVKLRYDQVIDSISVENDELGYLTFRFSIGDSSKVIVKVISSLVNIPNMKDQVKITSQQAIDIAIPVEREFAPHIMGGDSLHVVYRRKADLKYVNFGTRYRPEIRICWDVLINRYEVIIDAITGIVLRHEATGMFDINFNVKGKSYTADYTSNSSYTPMPHTYLKNNSSSGYTGDNGNVVINDDIIGSVVSELRNNGSHRVQYSMYTFSSYENYNNEIYGDIYNDIDEDVDLVNNVYNIKYNETGNENHGRPVNIFKQTHDFMEFMENNVFLEYDTSDNFTLSPLRIISNYPWPQNSDTNPDNDICGLFDKPSPNILISDFDGRFSHVINHELTHAIVYYRMNSSDFSDATHKAINEAYSQYFPCAYIDNCTMTTHGNYLNPTTPTEVDLLPLLHPIDNFDGVGPINENDYSHYKAGNSLASVFWKLRNSLTAESVNLSLYKIISEIEDYLRDIPCIQKT